MTCCCCFVDHFNDGIARISTSWQVTRRGGLIISRFINQLGNRKPLWWVPTVTQVSGDAAEELKSVHSSSSNVVLHNEMHSIRFCSLIQSEITRIIKYKTPWLAVWLYNMHESVKFCSLIGFSACMDLAGVQCPTAPSDVSWCNFPAQTESCISPRK